MSNDSTLQEQIVRKALTQIRKLAQGNGVAKDSIHIIKNQSDLITCEAITHIELTNHTKTEQKKGEHQAGEIVKNPKELPAQIEKISTGAIKNTEMRKALSNILLERQDKGFSLHAKEFDVPPLNRDFYSHIACETCKGEKITPCQTCGGQKQEPCNQCHGRTVINCNFCHGSGLIKGPDGQQKQCDRCFGKRQIKCPLCQSRGQIPCRGCKGAGHMKCGVCDGTGIFTTITRLFFKMKTLFEIDRSMLPHPVVKIIENKGSKLVQDGHLKLQAEPVKRKDGGLAIQYNFQFPYADLDIGINGQPLKVHMFGYKGKMLKISNFLDQLIQKNYALLLRAANKEGNIVSHIRKASKSRIIGEGLILSVTMRPKNAMLALKKKFPFGASNDIIKDIIIQSNKALLNISRRNHLSGLGIGLIITLFINILYFIGPTRNMIGNIVGTGNALTIIDFSLILIGGMISIFISKHMAASPLKKALGPLMPARQRSTFKPRNNNASWPAFVGSALILFFVVFGTKLITTANTPTWLPF